jgi:tetratricopeptide (TPR) repeat protein
MDPRGTVGQKNGWSNSSVEPDTASATTRLVGRDGELAALDAALTQALGGRREVVLLAGAAGIGKTSLARALADRARGRGANVVWGTGWDGGGAPAWWPWVQVVRTLSQGRSQDELRADLGAGAAWLATVVPDLRAALPDVSEPPPSEAEHERFRLLEALSLFLTARATAGPLVVVLDDLHWMDEASLRALEFIARTVHEVPLLVVGTYRDDEASRGELATVLEGLLRSARPLPLRPLGEAALAELVASHAGGAAPPELVRAVHDASGGNPFYADELLRLLRAEGSLTDSPGKLPLPDGVAETIRRRIAPLGPEPMRILTVAAVIGTEFRLGTLAAAAGVELTDALTAVDAATRAGLLIGSPRQSRFAHALVRDTLLQALTPGERSALHADVARALQERYGDTDEHLPEIAYHVLEAVPLVSPEEALRHALAAGHHAVARYDHAEGARLFDRAADLHDVLGPDDERDAEVFQALGEARVRAGDVGGGRAALTRAAAAARRLGDPMRLARAALASAPWGVSAGVVEEEIVALLAEAVDVLDEAGGNVRVDALRARLRARLAIALYWSPEADRRRRLVAEATELARSLRARVGPADIGLADATLAFVLGLGFVATWAPDTTEQGLETSEELLEICARIGDLERELNTRSWRISLLCELDDLPAARREAKAYAELAARLRQPRVQFYVPLQAGMTAILEGRYAEVEAHVAEALQLGQQAPGSLAPMLAAAQLGSMRIEQGRGAEILQAVEAFAAQQPAIPAWRVALAYILLESGRQETARDEFERLAAHDFADLPQDNLWFIAMWWLGHTAAGLGDAARASVLHDLLEPYAARNAVSPEAAVLGPVTRVLAMLAVTTGDRELASRHLATARRAAARMGARPTLAHVALLEARLLAEEDPARARTLATEATARADELGLAGVRAAAGELLATLEPPGPAPVQAQPKPRFVRPPAQTTAALRREGDVWAVGIDDRTFHLRDAKGLVHLAHLLMRPGQELHALDLVAVAEGTAVPARGAADVVVGAELEVRAGAQGDAGPVLDAEAKRAYRDRAAELQDELEEAEAFHDPERAARAREELAWLADQLSGAVGLGGRDRRTGSDAERARVNVTRAIRTVLRRIDARDAELGKHLKATIRTGTFCVYDPDAGDAVTWEIAL